MHKEGELEKKGKQGTRMNRDEIEGVTICCVKREHLGK